MVDPDMAGLQPSIDKWKSGDQRFPVKEVFDIVLRRTNFGDYECDSTRFTMTRIQPDRAGGLGRRVGTRVFNTADF